MTMRKVLAFSIIVLIAAFFSACNDESQTGVQLQEGDLLFIDLDCGPLCDAIDAVTEGVNGKDFSHCGMMVMHHDTLKVIEAIADADQLTSYEGFIGRSEDSVITVGRPNSQDSEFISKAARFAISKLGEPYDDAFLFGNQGWYCSELLHESFKYANDGQAFFEVSPMTFKDPIQEEYFDAWITYYEELNLPIPEGKPGVNPGGLSTSENLVIFEKRID